MRYYNEQTDTWYIESNSMSHLSEDGTSLFSGIPTPELLVEWGFEPVTETIVESTINPVEDAKKRKLEEISNYDTSPAVNSFEIYGKEMWLDVATRQQLRTSIESYRAMGIETVSKWFDGIEYTFPVNIWIQMLNALEVYASEALNTTERHKAAVSQLTSVEDIDSYDYMEGYPNKLIFKD